ncbi:MAG: hypothetical protein RBT41_11195 [Clostridia bacterium]|jgi:hypothetical protein|nr:hypothetical protein [Clostridia bacterium]
MKINKETISRIKEKIKIKIKEKTYCPIEKRISETMLNFVEIVRWNSFTSLGYEITNIRGNYYNNINKEEYKFEYELYMKKLLEFYRNEAESFCAYKTLDYTKELLLRRKEIRNQSNYFSNLFIGVGTGLFSGLLVDKFPLFIKFEEFINNLNPFLGVMISLVSSIVLFVAVFLLAAFILIMFKKSLLYECPYAKYAEEKELQIIEDIINTKLG